MEKKYEFRQEKGGSVSIYEIDTETIVQSYTPKEEKKAREIYRNLKRGGGFNGWTPTFFLPK